MRPLRVRRLAAVLLSAGALVVAVALSLGLGSKGLSVGEVIDGLTGAGGEAGSIMREQRVPRTVVGIAVGAALGVAGALIQAFTRNPLADPGILGVNAGAAFAIVVGVSRSSGRPRRRVHLVLLRRRDRRDRGGGGRSVPPAAAARTAPADPGRGRGRRRARRVRLGISLLLPSVFNRMRYWGAGTLAGRDMD